MGLRSCCKCISSALLALVLLFILIVYIPFLPPDAKISTPYKVEQMELTGKLALNKKLNDVKLWHENEIHGPESFADYNGELYTSLHSGYIVKLTGNHITPIVSFGKPCKVGHHTPRCGRPLGITFDSAGKLYAADCYYGIFKVDVRTGAKENIISMDTKIGGKLPKVVNSLVIDDNNDIYFTDSSTEFGLHDGVYDLLADGSGRFIKYDAKTKTTKVLIDNIHFANGVAFSRKKDFIIVSETARNRIHRYYISGPKANQHDIFIDKLPGMPDNLKALGQGGFIVALVSAADIDNPNILNIMGPFPKIRKFIARLFGITELLFIKIDEIYPNYFCSQAALMIGNFAYGTFLLPTRATILHISDNGEILDSLHADNSKITAISEAHIFRDTLYLGSPFNAYIGIVPLKDIGWSNLQVPIVKATAKPVTTQTPTSTTTPKATTTTSSPTTTTTAQKPTTTTTPKPTTTATTPKMAQTQTIQKPKPTELPTTTTAKTASPPTAAPTPTPTPTPIPSPIPTSKEGAPTTTKPVTSKP